MCECGCGDQTPIGKLEGVNAQYLIEIYPGCRYCGTPIAVSIYEVPYDGMEEGETDEVPTIPFGKYHEWHQPILDPEILQEEINSYDLCETEDTDLRFAVEEFFGADGLRTAVGKTMGKSRHD